MKHVFLLLALTTEICLAGARHFTFLYEAPTAAPGSFELENYATSLFDKSKFTGIDFRHELEIGITDRFQASIYVANWNYDRDKHAAHYDSASAEFIYNLSNPAADSIGISVYEEIGAGRRNFESETKFIAQKNFGPLVLLYNFTVEAEWEDEGLRERTGELQQAFGASYELSPRSSFGLEVLHEIILPDWRRDDADTNFFIGPNISTAAIAGSLLSLRSGSSPTPTANPITRCASSLVSRYENTHVARAYRPARFRLRHEHLLPPASFVRDRRAWPQRPRLSRAATAGRALFVSRCLECHTLPPVAKYSRDDWPRLVSRMAARADLTTSEQQSVTAYLRAAASP